MNKLLVAQSAVEKLYAQRGSNFYPRYHLAPLAGWMNDPNGLIWYNGVYHVFYQHHPFSEKQGIIHWGHATSSDMLHWQHQPIALAPGDEYDRDGCFSGCAVNDNGVLSLIYTGHTCLEDKGDNSLIREVQCLATSIDGIHFEKQGVILSASDDIMHFRDPKVWREEELWYMVVGAKHQNIGQIRLYSSENLREWQDLGVLVEGNTEMGYMWECPDFFALGAQRVLMFSPQGIKASGFQWRNLFQSGYLLGEWEPNNLFSYQGSFIELDYGHDFYAPQSFQAPDGRRIVIAWMDMWDSPFPEQKEGWTGMLSLPREVTLGENNRLLIRPVKEVKSLRRAWVKWSESTLHNQNIHMMENSEAVEIKLQWDCAKSNAEQYGLKYGLGLRVYVDNQMQRLVLERNYPDFSLCGTRSIPLDEGRLLNLQIFIDKSSVEIFVNNGEFCLSSRIYPDPGSRELYLFAWGGLAVLTEGDYWVLE